MIWQLSSSGSRLACAAGALLCLLTSNARAGAEVFIQKSGPAVLALEAKQKDTHIEIPYALVTMTIAVEGMAPLVVKPPAKWVASDTWTALAKGPARTRLLDGERMRWEQTLLLDPLAAGEQALQIEPLQYQEKSAAGAWHTIRWKPIQVLVWPRLAEADASHLRDITSIETVPTPAAWAGWPWLALAILVAAGAVLGLWFRRRRRLLAASLPPDEWARRELDRLLALGLPERGQGRRFHALLSNVLRHYLERRFALPARRQTTPEFFATAAKDHHFTPQQQAFLREVLERCDLAKFAGLQPPPQDCAPLAERVRGFVQETIPSTS